MIFNNIWAWLKRKTSNIRKISQDSNSELKQMAQEDNPYKEPTYKASAMFSVKIFTKQSVDVADPLSNYKQTEDKH